MKTLFIAILLFVTSFAVAQTDLYTETYSTVVRDSVALAGSTDAGSDWFTNAGYDKVQVIIFNGVYWYAYMIDAPVKSFTKFRIYVEGSDTTVRVQGYYSATVSIGLPVLTTSTALTWALDFGGDGSTIGAVTSPMMVMFKGYKKRDL